ncbi:MAG: hypothetical protein V2B15_05435 [Bacteroidota bacterium]
MKNPSLIALRSAGSQGILAGGGKNYFNLQAQDDRRTEPASPKVGTTMRGHMQRTVREPPMAIVLISLLWKRLEQNRINLEGKPSGFIPIPHHLQSRCDSRPKLPEMASCKETETTNSSGLG